MGDGIYRILTGSGHILCGIRGMALLVDIHSFLFFFYGVFLRIHNTNTTRQSHTYT